MTLVDELERAHALGANLAAGGEQVAAVMAAETSAGRRTYLIAYDRSEGFGYVLIDERGDPVRDRRLVRDAVSVIAMAERAEEVAGALGADRLAARFRDVEDRLGPLRRPAAEAAAGVAAAADGVAEAAAGPRVASPQYLDRIGHAAAELSAALDAYTDATEELMAEASAGRLDPEPAELARMVLAEAHAGGDPAGFGEALAAGSPAADALADDVVAAYRVELAPP